MGISFADKDALKRWREHFVSFDKGRDIDWSETPEQQQLRIARLEKSFTDWARYYFPKVCKAEFASWHKRYANHVIEHDDAFVTLKVSRDMAKSSVTALLILFLKQKRKFRNMALFSHIQTQAEKLLRPIKSAYELNEAFRRDYGNQVGFPWTSDHFILSDGTSFRAVGAGQNPRGEKTDSGDRLDLEVFDDFDDPEVCRNPERLDNNWKYVLGDCFPAMHVSGSKRVLFLNNKIDEGCIIERAWNHSKALKNSLRIQVNLVDGNGKSNWPEAFTNEQCREMIRLVGDEAETEYMNNPAIKGKFFRPEWFQYKKMPALNSYKYLVAYLDGGFKKSKTADTKALLLVGKWQNEYHIRKCFVENVSIGTMIDWHYQLHEWLKQQNSTAVWYMEEVFLLGMLHEHFDAAAIVRSFRIPMLGDKRKKPDKDLRIANTAGVFERNCVFFDERIKDDRHTGTLINQYLRFRVGISSLQKDGPDAFEGAKYILDAMVATGAGAMKTGTRKVNSKYK